VLGICLNKTLSSPCWHHHPLQPYPSCQWCLPSHELALSQVQVYHHDCGSNPNARKKLCDRICVALKIKFALSDFTKLVSSDLLRILGSLS
jgi:hypothetical protein